MSVKTKQNETYQKGAVLTVPKCELILSTTDAETLQTEADKLFLRATEKEDTGDPAEAITLYDLAESLYAKASSENDVLVCQTAKRLILAR